MTAPPVRSPVRLQPLIDDPGDPQGIGRDRQGEDFRTAVERVGVPPGQLRREMATHDDRDYRKWYTPKLRDVVGERYREDIKCFGYDF